MTTSTHNAQTPIIIIFHYVDLPLEVFTVLATSLDLDLKNWFELDWLERSQSYRLEIIYGVVAGKCLIRLQLSVFWGELM